MNTLHAFVIVLASWLPAWPCAALMWWLWRHRHVQVPRGIRRGKAAGERAHPRAKSNDVRRKLLYLCAHLDGAGCRTVAHVFNRWQAGQDSVGKTTVWNFMRKHEAEICERRQRKRCLPRLVPVGHTWALDLTFIRSPYGASFKVLGILDAGSRKLLTLKVVPTKCALVILGHVLIAMGVHGIPNAIRTDNESMFTSKLWLMSLKALGVAHHRSPPYQPWRNGRIERFFGTLKTSLRGLRFEAVHVLQRTLDTFARWYNHARPHQGLNGLAPEEAWQGKAKADLRQAHHDHKTALQVRRSWLEWQRLRCSSG